MLSATTRVIVYDNSSLQSELLATGLESLELGFEIKCANNPESLVDLLSAKHLRTRFHGLPLVFLLQEGRGDRVIEAFRTGARGIVYSNESLSQLADCIAHVYKGEVWVRGIDLGLILDGLLKPSVRVTDVTGRTLLSPREEEISRLVAEGMSNREVARALKISESTVKNSLFHVFEKLGISNRVELARYVTGAAEQEGRAFQ
jgi:DNA-binding NarL/FixJ family response regulator